MEFKVAIDDCHFNLGVMVLVLLKNAGTQIKCLKNPVWCNSCFWYI